MTGNRGNRTTGKKPEGAGRKKGTPNKRSLGVAEFLTGLGFDALAEMVKLYREPATSEASRVRIVCELASFQYPKRRAIEHSGEIGTSVSLVISGA